MTDKVEPYSWRRERGEPPEQLIGEDFIEELIRRGELVEIDPFEGTDDAPAGPDEADEEYPPR